MKNNQARHHVFQSIIVVEIVLTGLFGAFASQTVITHLAQVLGLTFRSYAYLSLLLTICILILVFVLARKWLAELTIEADQGRVLLKVALAGIVGAGLALALNRPDVDDYYYVPNAVYHLQNPDTKMGFEVFYLHSNGAPFVSYTWATSLAYEYIQSVVAYFTGVDYLSVYYLLMPALTGILIVVALFYAVSIIIEDTRNAIVGTFLTVGIILLLGETHRTFGNLSLARAFQGKTLILSVGIPLYAALSYGYFKKPTFRSWLLLFCVATSMVGATASAVILLPALASVLVIAHFMTRKPLIQHGWVYVTYTLTLSYVLAYGIAILNHSVENLGSDSPVNKGWPTTFHGHLQFLINAQVPLTPVLFLISTFLCLALLRSQSRNFILAWIVAALVLFLNPFVAPFIIQNITTPNAYWRLFYILPFPLVIAISISLVFQRWVNFPEKKRALAILLAAIVVVGSHFQWSGASVFRAENKTKVDWPTYKLDKNVFEVSKQVAALAPTGAMLAPPEIAGQTAMLDADFPQMRVRESAVRLWLGSQGQAKDAELRINASNFVGGSGTDFDSFKRLILQHPDILSIVLKDVVWKDPDVGGFLMENGFLHSQDTGKGYIVVRR